MCGCYGWLGLLGGREGRGISLHFAAPNPSFSSDYDLDLGACPSIKRNRKKNVLFCANKFGITSDTLYRVAQKKKTHGKGREGMVFSSGLPCI